MPGSGAITDIPGLLVGHAEKAAALTGCTVILCPLETTVGVAVRGAAPATRETDLCRPGTLLQYADAILLCGGSAFGLAAGDGVMRYLAERGRGFDTGVARVPIVPAAGIFDLGIGEATWPDAATGYAACMAASATPPAEGCAGVGLGATVGKLLGPQWATKSGIGTAAIQTSVGVVAVLVVVNAAGDVVDPQSGRILAGARLPSGNGYAGSEATLLASPSRGAPLAPNNTTIGVVATDARISSEQANRLAAIAHDGLARSIRPVHTMVDGDTLFALGTGSGAVPDIPALLVLQIAAVHAVELAVQRAVLLATSRGGLPASYTGTREAEPHE